jgi:serine/threonine protein kinase/N-acetylneuraminic acid mutarotase
MSNTPGKSSTVRQGAQESLIGRTLCDGEYTIQQVLGHGGMGKVYLATHTHLKLPFALKQARADRPLPEGVIAELNHILQGNETVRQPSSGLPVENDFPVSGGIHTDRFLREALLLARLHHPALPTLYDYFFEDGCWYMVMDYIPGPTLSAYLRQHAPLAPLEALNYAIQLCDMLDYLHQQPSPVIFRDLKPSNIILTPEGAVMLVDFGIARYYKTGQVNDTMDFGSPGYASPEQYLGGGQTDARSDLFSLGVILHEMIGGKRPNASGNLDAIRRLNPSISMALSGLITLATRSDPAYRFQSAQALYLALERVYAIEERLAYRRHLLKHADTTDEEDKQKTIQEMGEQESPLSKREGDLLEQIDDISEENQSLVLPVSTQPEPSTLSRLSFDLQQRHQLRGAIQQARRERLVHEQMEIQLASVDESLKRRALALRSQSIQALPQEEVATSGSRSRRKSRLLRPVLVCFTVVLLVFLLLILFMTYAHFMGKEPIITHGQLAQIEATSPYKASISGTWQVLPSLPSAEADNTAIYTEIHGRPYIYMHGGYRGAKRPPYYDRNLYRYDIEAARWERVPHKNFPGMLNNAVARDEHGNLFYTAGYSTDEYHVTSLLYLYQPADGTLRKIVPPPHIEIGFGMAMLADQQGHLYITQGYSQEGDPDAVAGKGWYRYDIANGRWHVLAPLPAGLGYVLLGSDTKRNIVLQGGASDAGQHRQSDRIYRYDVVRNTWWKETKQMPRPLSGAVGCQVTASQMIVIGGYDAQQKKGSSNTWSVDLLTLRWKALPPFPAGGAVLGAAACDRKGHLYLVRGASDPSHPTPDFWQLTVALDQPRTKEEQS